MKIIRGKSLLGLILVIILSFGSAQRQAVAMEVDTDRPGMDYKNFDLPSPDPKLCEDACKGDPNCKAWTYVKPEIQGSNARCWLKSGVPSAVKNNCCVSGVMQAQPAIAPQPWKPFEEGYEIPAGSITTLKDACDKYAKDAVLQNQHNEKIGCGYSGLQWNSDYNNHFNWCMNGNLNLTKGENNARQAALAKCRTSKCDEYAKIAVLQNDSNLQMKCGFTGPLWNSDYNYHFNWCMNGDNVQFADKETKARADIKGKCSGCYSYAGFAVTQNQENIMKGCGFSGPQWNSSHSYHFAWCMDGDNWKLAKDETDQREYALDNKCTKTPPPPPPSAKTATINGFKQVPYTGNIYYIANIKIPNGILTSVKNPNLGLGKQWIVLIIPAGSSSADCGKPGKTIDLYPGSSTTKLQGTSLNNLILGFCLSPTDGFTYSQGLPNIWALEITYKQ